ncbi:MAG: hypothetical protein GX591_04290 [Planctomycetes bacterium]|nr:hypothetical protein [Planctomycetota bacterium]
MRGTILRCIVPALACLAAALALAAGLLLRPSRGTVRLEQARLALEAGNPHLALHEAALALQHDPASADALWIRGRAQLKSEQFDPARRTAEAFVALHGDDPRGHRLQVEEAFRRMPEADAAATLEAQAAWFDAHGSAAEAALIRACIDQDGADEHLRRALRAEPTLWAAWDLALFRARRSADPAALSRFACHLADQPSVPAPLACDTIQAVLSSPRGPSPADRLAVCTQLAARIDAAGRQTPAADLAGAYVALAAGRLDEARAALHRILAAQPSCAEAKRLLALALAAPPGRGDS